MRHKRYPSDITDSQWKSISKVIPKPKTGGRPRTTNIREILNAIFYLNRSGCAWRMLPKDFPPMGTVYYYFKQWKEEGIWQEIHDTLRSQVRIAEGRNNEPTAAIIDSQSIKTTEKGGFLGMMLEKKSRVENGILWSMF